MVKQNVSAIEKQVEQAENEMGSMSSIKKAFSGFPVPSFLFSVSSKPFLFKTLIFDYVTC